MKKAQVPVNPQSYIALLIFVIGLTLIIYILMLPPSERADLLEQNRTTNDGEKSEITVLMTKEPGTLSNIADTEITEDLPGFNLFSRTDTTEIVSFDSIYVKKSLFEEQQRNLSFRIDDFKNTGNYVLSFTVPKHKGTMTLILNNQILSSNEYQTDSPPPIRLPKDWLKEDNTIVFRVSGPSLEFWSSNEYQINNMKITADVTDVSGQENRVFFVVNEQEKANLKSFELTFVVDCKETEVSPIQIYLNKRRIYSSIPDCSMPVKVPPLDSSTIEEGRNEILFTIEKGYYEIYNIETKLNLKEPIYPTYYFYLTEDTYSKIKNGDADINVTLLFTNEEEIKKGYVLMNSIKRDINGYSKDFNWKVNDYIRKGNNAVEIQPKSDKLEILELNILMAE
jgi:hypothetical protein